MAVVFLSFDYVPKAVIIPRRKVVLSMRNETRFGKKIKEFRLDRGWSQEQLGEIAGIATRTVQRVEKDQTRDGETLRAIAAAFGVTVKDLRTDYLVAESYPPKALMINSADDFRIAIQRAYHFHTYRSLVQPRTDTEARVRELVDIVFSDLWAMEPDEPELISYIESIREPLEELTSMGVKFFSIQERRDLFVKGQTPGERLPMEDVTYGHYYLVPINGCFRPESTGKPLPLHRFSAKCQEAVKTLLQISQKELDMWVVANPVYVPGAATGADDVRWCDNCFPPNEDGSRISWSDLEQVTGLTSDQMIAIIDEARNIAANMPE
jgi:transcriptional regulator with XRE-family HTH domain